MALSLERGEGKWESGQWAEESGLTTPLFPTFSPAHFPTCPPSHRRKFARGPVTEPQPAIHDHLGDDFTNHADYAQNRQRQNQSCAPSYGRAEKEHQHTEKRVDVKFPANGERQKNEIV